MESRTRGKIEFPDLGSGSKVVIIVTGHPCTGKAKIARCIGQWAGCQVCYLDDFLRAFSLEKRFTVSSPPSGEEGERIHRLALDALYSAALPHLSNYWPGEFVVIKSRLSSTFELDLLVNLFKIQIGPNANDPASIIIVECRIQNEYRWRSHVQSSRLRPREEEWYKVRSWKDIQKAMEDCVDSQSLDLHLHSSFQDCKFPSITRLVLDYSNDFSADPGVHLFRLTPYFQRALKYILTEQVTESKDYRSRASYVAEVQLKDMRRYLLEKELDASTNRTRREYLCTGENNIVDCCLFKYWEELQLPGDEVEASLCGVCDQKMIIGEAAYTCHFCILNLHSSCAEFPLDFTFLQRIHNDKIFFFFYQTELSEVFTEKRNACKSCKVKGKDFSTHCQSCVFRMHLRCGMLPTIIKHDCHPQHFLSIQCVLSYEGKNCNACGPNYCVAVGSGYVCHICNIAYDMVCIFLPGEVKVEHGGYDHVMKLMYSHDNMDQEDDHWCNGCYKEMDPQNWFYFCQDCPYYVTHADRVCVGNDRIQEAVRNGDLPIQQLRGKLKSL